MKKQDRIILRMLSSVMVKPRYRYFGKRMLLCDGSACIEFWGRVDLIRAPEQIEENGEMRDYYVNANGWGLSNKMIDELFAQRKVQILPYTPSPPVRLTWYRGPYRPDQNAR